MPGPADRPRIVVAGGGPAALEALLTLAERLPADARELTLVAPDRALSYRPLSAVGEFATHPPHELPLADVAAATAATLVRDRIAMVDEARGRLLTHDGDWVYFDRLLVAVGTRALPLPSDWLRWPPEGDPAVLFRLLQAIGSGRLRRIGVVVPAGAGWSLPGYELAAILAVAARAGAVPATVTLVVEDRGALAALGEEAEEIIESELARAGVELVTGAPVGGARTRPTEGGTDWLSAVIRRLRAPVSGPGARRIEVAVGDRRITFDRVIALPGARGPGIGGVALDEHGYVAVDDRCRVLGSERVWAAGDCTTVPVKHSTLAVAQADAAADALAASVGAPLEAPGFEPVLTGILVAGAAGRWWRENTNLPAGLQPATHCLWWPPGRVLGRRLAHYLSRLDPAARPLLLGHPRGTAIEVRLAAAGGAVSPDGSETGTERPGGTGDDPLRLDSYHRRLHALRRVEREAARGLHDLEQGLDQQRARSREVLVRLSSAGYLVKERPDAD